MQVSLGRAIISNDDGPAGKYLSFQFLLFQKTERGPALFRDVFWRENSKKNFCFGFLFIRGRTSNPGQSREVTKFAPNRARFLAID